MRNTGRSVTIIKVTLTQEQCCSHWSETAMPIDDVRHLYKQRGWKEAEWHDLRDATWSETWQPGFDIDIVMKRLVGQDDLRSAVGSQTVGLLSIDLGVYCKKQGTQD